MKKLLAAILAAVLVCSMGVSALAKKDATIDLGDFGLMVVGAEDGELPRIQLGEDYIVDTDWSADGLAHSGDVTYPDKTGYFPLLFLPWSVMGYREPEMASIYANPTFMKEWGNLLTDKKLTSVKTYKETGSKLLKSVELVQKTFDPHPIPDDVKKHEFNHIPALKFTFNNFDEDDEQKVEGYVDVKIKKTMSFDDELGRFVTFHSVEELAKYRELHGILPKGWEDWNADDWFYMRGGWDIIEGTVIRIPFAFFLNNRVVTTGDETMTAGAGGYIVKPEKNEDGAYEWEDENRTLATLDFGADSDPGKLYSKLSTRWSDLGDGFYAEHFADRDAFLLNFVAGPSAPATAYNAKLSLRFPFVDEDGEPTVEEGEWTVYEVVDGELADVTAKWTLAETDDGDWVLTSRTRKLGTYIIAGPQGAAEAAEGEAAPVATGITLSAYAR